MRAAVVVPAYNEEKTVGAVVRTLIASGLFGEVIVVSDGSTDRTAAAARDAGAALVSELPDRRGKGAALGRGLARTDAPVVCFIDADLKGLTVEHLRRIIEPVAGGRLWMNVGILSRGLVWNALAARLPLIGGQRAVRRAVFEAVPPKYLRGYKVESALNYFCRANGLPYGFVMLRGLDFTRKMEKFGFRRGLFGYLKMFVQIGWAIVQVRLHRREFVERGAHMGHRH